MIKEYKEFVTTLGCLKCDGIESDKKCLDISRRVMVQVPRLRDCVSNNVVYQEVNNA